MDRCAEAWSVQLSPEAEIDTVDFACLGRGGGGG